MFIERITKLYGFNSMAAKGGIWNDYTFTLRLKRYIKKLCVNSETVVYLWSIFK